MAEDSVETDPLNMQRETLKISGDRNLYKYTFQLDGDVEGTLIEAIERGDGNAVEAWMRANAGAPLDRGERPYGPLHIAAKFGHSSIIRLLVAQGAPLEEEDAEYHTTPLAWAAFYGKAEAFQALVEVGAELNQKVFDTIDAGLRGELNKASRADYEEVANVVQA